MPDAKEEIELPLPTCKLLPVSTPDAVTLEQEIAEPEPTGPVHPVFPVLPVAPAEPTGPVQPVFPV